MCITNKIIFAGTGRLGEVCLKALQQKFDAIDIVNNGANDNIIGMKRGQDNIILSIQASHVPYVFLAGWLPLISAEDLSRKTYINIHGSILPKYRGIHSIFWMIMNGEEYLGYTVYKVNEFVDDGDIIHQYKFPYVDYTISEVHNIFYQDIKKNLTKVVYDYIHGSLSPVKQDFSCATWVPKRNLNDCLIDFNMPNRLLRRFFLALTPPYPLPRLIHKNIVYEIIESSIIDTDYYCQTGRAVNSDSTGVYIKTKDGLLIVRKIRSTASKETVDANMIIRSGYRFNSKTKTNFASNEYSKSYTGGGYNEARLSASNTRIELYVLFHYLCAV